jgi:hypothetical protein
LHFCPVPPKSTQKTPKIRYGFWCEKFARFGPKKLLLFRDEFVFVGIVSCGLQVLELSKFDSLRNMLNLPIGSFMQPFGGKRLRQKPPDGGSDGFSAYRR